MPFAVVAITSWRSWRYHVIKMIKPVVLQTDHFVLHSREKSRDFHLFFSPKWKSQVGQFKTVINVVFARNSNYLYMSLFYKHTKFRLMYVFRFHLTNNTKLWYFAYIFLKLGFKPAVKDLYSNKYYFFKQSFVSYNSASSIQRHRLSLNSKKTAQVTVQVTHQG